MTGDPAVRPLHHWFLDGLARNPDGPALDLHGRRLSYRRVHELACRCAAVLAAESACRVGVLAAKSEEAYVGVLGALYAGAAYVPLGPDVPVERNREVAAAAGVDALVVDAAGAEQLDAVAVAIVPRTVVGPGLPPAVGTVPPAAVSFAPAEPDPGETAYILFTSGSTGRPKGVPISHANVGAFLSSSLRRFDIGPADRFSQVYELTFDLAVFDMFLAWAVGACVCVMSRLHAMNPVRIADRYGLTVWHSTPSLVGTLRGIDALPPGGLPGLRYSVFCGEQLPVELASYWLRGAPRSALYNIYGPTELTIACTAHHWVPGADRATATVPIGWPNDRMEFLLLDAEGRPATERGELCMTGPQMFAGYLIPADDRDRFITSGGRRWYRTGDRVRLEPSVGMIHLGRTDDQVKIRGYRVELGEVEHALRRVCGAEAVALVVDGPEEPVLVAFIVTRWPVDGAVVTQALQALAAVLPDYMMPRHVWRIDRAPLNRNGKTDRAALRMEAARRLVPARVS